MSSKAQKTTLTLSGEQQLRMAPDTRSLITDFRCLKVRLPFTAHLQGVVVGERRVRLTNTCAEQICFTLMDRQRRTVACIAHDVSISQETFTGGAELVLFYVVGQEWLRKAPGAVWIFHDSYVLLIKSILLPGTPIDKTHLMS